jgi:hypothetical protein
MFVLYYTFCNNTNKILDTTIHSVSSDIEKLKQHVNRLTGSK